MLFVDASVFYAAADTGDRYHSRAATIVTSGEELVTSDHVLVETWALLRNHIGRHAAEHFWSELRQGVPLEPVTAADLEVAWSIGEAFPDQDFSLVDRTSFAVMQRLGVLRAASFDDHFAIYRFGRTRDRAFEIIR
jgi:predicted nucleic acid-binding protein